MSTPSLIAQESSGPQAKILVGTPCYGGMCFIGYVASLMQAKDYLRTKNIQLETCFLTNESLIPRGRNTIVAKFMNDPSFTHLLFVDSDITFNHLSIERLIYHDKGVVGALYPKKGYQWDKLKDATDLISAESFDENAVKCRMMSYVVNYTNDRQVVNGLLRVKHIGTGFFMVKREVIMQMMEKYADLKYDDDINILTPSENQWLYALFDCEVHQLGQRRHYLSEDYLFCKRWQDIGGEIFADVTIPLTHTGTHSFVGNFLKSIQFEPSKQPNSSSNSSSNQPPNQPPSNPSSIQQPLIQAPPNSSPITPSSNELSSNGPQKNELQKNEPQMNITPVVPNEPTTKEPTTKELTQSNEPTTNEPSRQVQPIIPYSPMQKPIKRISPADIAKMKIF